MSDFVSISWQQLCIAVLLVSFSGAASIYYHLKLEKDIFVGVVRTFVQLIAMGYLLKILFGLNNVFLVLLVFACMTLASINIIQGRVKEKQFKLFSITSLAVFVSYSLITFLVTKFVVSVEPWWKPQFFIPIGGMVAGNSMNALALTLERFFSELRLKRDQIEMFLCYGATYKEATEDIFRVSLRAGLIPAINAMMSVGIVFLPGMMTGQILAGAVPTEAVKYQIVVMLMLTASTALASILVLSIVRREIFSKRISLNIDRSKS